VKWEHFVSKLQPAEKETWTAVVSGPDAKKAVAELVAALYDASLDAYQAQNWPGGFGLFRLDQSQVYAQFENMLKPLQFIHIGWQINQKDARLTYRHFPYDIIGNFFAYEFARGEGRGMRMLAGAAPAAALRKSDRAADGVEREQALNANGLADKTKRPGDG